MRIHRVEIEGFGPFRTRQVVDLDAYAADGLFLIGGRTGAGKSSILDAVAFAIFGSVPRYEGGEKRLRSDHCEPDDPTSVGVEFTSRGTRWRIERAPEYERPKRRGEGMTTSPATSRMGVVVGEDVEWKAVRDRDVAVLVAEEIGLTKDQFLQVILLAQGRFAEFLLAGNNDRQRLLRTLFGSRRFEEYEAELGRRKSDAEGAVAHGVTALTAVLDHADTLAEALPEIVAPEPAAGADRDVTAGPVASPEDLRLARLALHERRARHEVEIAEAVEADARERRAAAEAERDRRRGDREKQTQRDELRATLDRLEAAASGIEREREELAAARRAESVRGSLDAATRALAAVVAAADAVGTTSIAWAEVDGDTGLEPAGLDALAEAAQRNIGAWQPVQQLEQGLPAHEKARAALHDEEEAASADLDDVAQRLDAIPSRRRDLDESAAAAGEIAAARALAADRLETLAARLAAAQAAASLAEEYARSVEAAQAALRAREAADRELGDLHRRRLGGYAGELARALVDGEACAVCGSTAHPAPAERADDHVTAEQIEAAEERKTATATAELAASEARRVAQQALVAAEAKAGGLDVETLDADRAASAERLAAADAAVAELAGIDAARVALADEEALLAARRDALGEARSERAARIRSLDDEIARVRARIADAQGGAASVAERIAAERTRASAATAFAQAQRDAARAERAASDAADALAAALDDAGFADVEAARAAIREPATRQALEQRIARHDADLRSTKATLVDLELLVLGAEPIDVAEAERALAAASDARDDAQARLGAMRQLATSLGDALARADQAHRQIAEAAREAAVVRDLADAVAGRNGKKMDLETFVLAAELEGIVEAANRRLDEMSGGRYALRHTDAVVYRSAASGLGLEVMDRFTGQARSPRSLSGGETFLASLALALGLAEVVTNRAGGIALDTLFIDEGFGSLDAETLDVAMRTLDGLREGGRTVGVISHVEAMKEQIPAQLRVDRSPHGWSVVSQEVSV
ncbi:SMC family ATPase [Microbacterium betulae]|uniref:Nuclease SbcCD subunit C n=1 Tax=Microbacterium betulae TaxID=2981139 RepID=A0AA97I7F0_9MICO|nr:SMC family ATPase [Microbacterium sp. AB]WOF23552.1 SMC family ATPase [Microbacterium sp. AB]